MGGGTPIFGQHYKPSNTRQPYNGGLEMKFRSKIAITAITLSFALLHGCGGGGNNGGSTDATVNSTPIADAGTDQKVATGNLVTLNGSGTDADGDSLTFIWELTTVPDGSVASLSNNSSKTPTFTADIDGQYVATMTVSDGTQESAPDSVTITAETANSTPVADAGVDQEVNTGTLVTLNGSGTDADGDALDFTWDVSSVPEGSEATLSNISSPSPTFMPDLDGIYSISLTVSDGTETSAPDIVTINSSTNFAPIADAGTNQNVTTGSLVTLNGNGTDAEGELLDFNWGFTSLPAESKAVLTNASTPSPMFTADVDGEFVIALIVNDGTQESAPDSVTITAETANSAPVADAGVDQEVNTGALVTLNGSGTDADGDPLTFSWEFTSRPEGSAAVLSDTASPSPTFTPDIDGAYVLALIVNDGIDSSALDSVTITANTANSAPVADAGVDQEVNTGALVTLNGSGTDADGDPLTFSWAFTSRPEGSAAVLSDSASPSPTFTADIDGVYVMELTVTDGAETSQSDSFRVTATTPANVVGSVDVYTSKFSFIHNAADSLTVQDWTSYPVGTILDGQTVDGIFYTSTSPETLVVGSSHGPGWILGYARENNRYASFSSESIIFSFSTSINSFGINLSQGNSSGGTSYTGSTTWIVTVDGVDQYTVVANYDESDFTGEAFIGLDNLQGASQVQIHRQSSTANIVWDIREIQYR